MDAKLLDIWIPDIRDADAAILIFEGNVWMIDCGDQKAAKRLVMLMRQLGIRKIDRLFNTHPHHDHLNGLQMRRTRPRVEELLICFGEDSTDSMIQAMTVCRGPGIPVSRFYGRGYVSPWGTGR